MQPAERFHDQFDFWGRRAAGNGWQLGLQVGGMAQFLLERGSSYPLINADYVVGLPVTWRRARVSARLRLAEYYNGSIPNGQFFHEKEDHVGLGLHLGL